MSGLVLGPVAFQAFEVPERIRFGGRQLVAVHVLPGGGRVVDTMGADETPLSWSGVFSGPGASARVRVLERLRRDGSALPLSWEGWRYTVVVTRFEAEGVNPAWIPYRIEACVVAADDVVPVEALPAVASAAEAASLGAGPEINARIDVATVSLASGDVRVAMRAASSLAQLVAARAFTAAAGSLA